MSLNFVENVLSQCAEKFRRGTLHCVTFFRYRNFFLLNRLRSRFSVEIVLSHNAEIFRTEETPCCI